jgi:hypothetical protein
MLWICSILLGLVLCVIGIAVIGGSIEPPPPAQTPQEYGFSSEPAIWDCAKAYGVRRDTVEPEARKALVDCVETMRKLGNRW